MLAEHAGPLAAGARPPALLAVDLRIRLPGRGLGSFFCPPAPLPLLDLRAASGGRDRRHGHDLAWHPVRRGFRLSTAGGCAAAPGWLPVYAAPALPPPGRLHAGLLPSQTWFFPGPRRQQPSQTGTVHGR